jgi:hypothetical protein
MIGPECLSFVDRTLDSGIFLLSLKCSGLLYIWTMLQTKSKEDFFLQYGLFMDKSVLYPYSNKL